MDGYHNGMDYSVIDSAKGQVVSSMQLLGQEWINLRRLAEHGGWEDSAARTYDKSVEFPAKEADALVEALEQALPKVPEEFHAGKERDPSGPKTIEDVPPVAGAETDSLAADDLFAFWSGGNGRKTVQEFMAFAKGGFRIVPMTINREEQGLS